jgi:sugar (pentulose or hexulose) kinase
VLPDASVFQGVPAKVATPERTYTFDDLETQRAPMTALGQDYFAALNLGLAIATREAMNRCGADQGTTVYLEGGFTNNRVYCELLAALCPGNTIALTSQKEGTSFGAALTGWMMVERLDLEAIGKEFTIESTAIPRRDYGDLDAYVDAFKEHLRV